MKNVQKRIVEGVMDEYLSREKLNRVEINGTLKRFKKIFWDEKIVWKLRTEVTNSFHNLVVDGKNDFLKRSVWTGNNIKSDCDVKV